MTIRTTEKTVRFVRPFSLKGAERSFPAGAYRVTTDEELIEGISLLAYRRVSTMILVPGGLHGSSVEMLSIDPADLDAAQRRDAEGVMPTS
jgi:hypothetical protein